MAKILNSKFYILFIILIIAAFLRLYNITEVPAGLYPDEAMNGNNALEALSTGQFKVFYPENNGREGLFINIQAIFLAIFGNQPWALRLPSALFGILTVLGIYFLTKELFKDRRVALLSSFLMAVSFWHINFSRIGFRAIMAPFFAVWAIYFLLKSLNKIKQENSKFYILNSIFSGIFFGLGFYSYIAFRALPLLILIILFIYWLKNKEKMVRKKILLIACLFTLATLIIFAPLGYYFLKNPQDFFGRTTQISIFNSPTPLKDLGINILKTAGMFNFAGDWNWRHNYAGKPELFWLVGIIFILGVVLSIRRLFSTGTGRPLAPAASGGLDSRQADSDFVGDQAQPASETFRTKTGGGFLASIIILAWFIIASLPVVVSNEGMPHALRAILMIPPVFILAGFGGAWLYEKLLTKIQNFTNVRKFIINTSLFIILSLLVFQAYYTYFVLWAPNPNTFDAFSADYVWIAKGLNNLPKELPKYVIVEAGGVDVRGIPMSAQTVMFITDTFIPEKQKEKNIYYVLPNKISQIPKGSYVVTLK